MKIGIGIGMGHGGSPPPLLQYAFNGWPSSITGGGQAVADHAGDLVRVSAGVPAMTGLRLATTVADGATLGPELMTNGGFGTDTSWVKEAGWTISSGTAFANTSSGTVIYQSVGQSGKRYRITYSIISFTSGGFLARAAGTNGTVRTAIGTYTEELVGVSGTAAGILTNGATVGAVDNISVREVIPTWKTTDTNGDPLFPSHTLRTRNGSVTQYDSDYTGVLVEGARTNKVTCRKVNPVDTTNVTKSGDAAAVLSVVDDSAALAAAGLDKICTSGKVYKLDNSAGTTQAFATLSGATGNTNTHASSAYIRATGAGYIGHHFSTTWSGAIPTYTKKEYIAAGTAGSRLEIQAAAGAVVYFILPELIEASFLGSPVIPPPAEDTTTSYTRPAVVVEVASEGKIRSRNCVLYGRVIPQAGGQSSAALFSTYTDSNNYLNIENFASGTFGRILKKIGGVSTYLDLSPVFTYAADTPFEYLAAWTEYGMLLSVGEFVDGVWVGDWATNANTDAAPIADTFQIGSRNGANHFAGNYPFLKTAFIPYGLGSLDAVKTWITNNRIWQEVI